ncbi:MAG: transcriptional regulator, partial [Clostridiales bacterium]|nr:transcriptional regulator [Clostridiales bacterium]
MVALMGNRILKESICSSDSIDGLSWFEEVLFYRLIVNCDDYGRFDGRTAIIKNRLFPLKDDLTKKTVEAAIDRLVSAGLVALYTFEGKPYLYLPTWDHHQNVRAR